MIETIITSSLLIIVVASLRLILLGKISMRLQYALWGIVALRLMLPFSLIPSAVSVLNAVQIERVETVLEDTAMPEWLGDKSDADIPVEELEVSEKAALPLLDFLRVVWINGVKIAALWFLALNLFLWCRMHHAVWVDAKDCPMYVYESNKLPSPCLFGIIRPAIYLTPESLSDGTRMRYILAHEQTHFRHGDQIWSLLRGVLLCVYWFNPLVWLAAVLSQRDSELACDEGTLKKLGEDHRIEYGRTIVDMVKIRKRPYDLLCAATMMTGSKKRVRERIRLIAVKRKTLKDAVPGALIVAAFAVVCTFTGAIIEPAWSADTPDTLLSSFDATFEDGGVTFTLTGKYLQSPDGTYKLKAFLDNVDENGARVQTSGLARFAWDESCYDRLQMLVRKDTGEGVELVATSETPIDVFYIQTPTLLHPRDEWKILATSDSLDYELSYYISISPSGAGIKSVTINYENGLTMGSFGGSLVTEAGEISHAGSNTRITGPTGMSGWVQYTLPGAATLDDGFYLVSRNSLVRLNPRIQGISTNGSLVGEIVEAHG